MENFYACRAGQIGIAGLAQKILAPRLAKVEAGKGEFLTLTQLKKLLQNL